MKDDPNMNGRRREQDRTPPADQEEITSSSIQNAHASGDGAIQKADEDLLASQEDDEINKENY